MEMKRLLKRAHALARPCRVGSGKGFRLVNVDPKDTLVVRENRRDLAVARRALLRGG